MIVTRHTINLLTLQEQVAFNAIMIPIKLSKHTKIPVKFKHYANPMVHPFTGETISSYKKLMNGPATSEVWQTASGKDFRGMAQDDNKTGQKGTNAMFVMSREEILSAFAARIFLLTPIPLLTSAPKKMICIGSESQPEGTCSHMMAMHLCAPPT